MSETRYTPKDYRDMAQEVCDEYKTTKAETDPIAAMLRQAATDAEALDAKDKEIARLKRLPDSCASCDNDEHYAEMQRANRAEAALTAQRQKVRELREYLDNEIVVAIKCDEQSANTADANWFRGKAEGYAWAVKRMDALGLTGDATEGQG